MIAGSLFSGIGGLDHGLARAGFRHQFFCEQDPWRRTVLAHHWPGVTIYDDVRAVGEPTRGAAADGSGAPANCGRWEAGSGLLSGGFPCQDVSVAGQRRGLAGARSGLFHEFARVIDALRPRWVLVENVPGLFSSNGGRDFGTVIGTLADLGYGVAWRVLDSRFFGVPQRRRRVFIVGAVAVGDPRAAAERAGQVLAVGSRCDRHPATGHQEGPNTSVASLSGLGNGGPDDNDGQAGRLVAASLRSNPSADHHGDESRLIANTVRSHPRPGSNSDGNLVAGPLGGGIGRRSEDDPNLVTAFAAKGGGGGSFSEKDIAPTLSAHGDAEGGQPPAIAYALRRDPGGTGQAHNTNYVREAATVRRLTPTECERLQALPDGWTNPNGGAPDSRRYAALGDAVTSSVGEWIGRRIIAEEAV